MRRFISILLLLAFGFAWASPLLALEMATGADAGVPACCRRAGKHHCMMTVAEREQATKGGARLSAPAERCPYAPASLIVVHSDLVGVAERLAAAFSPAMTHPTGIVQTESKRRISLDRSRQKRGPPVSVSA